MSQLSLSNYKKKVPTNLPEWVENGTKSTKLLYQAVLEEVGLLKKGIMNGKGAKKKERTIVLSKIAQKVKVSRSLLNKRRQPRLISFIEEENIKLNSLWVSEKELRSGTHLSKDELEKEVAKLRATLATLEESNYRIFLEAALEFELLTSQKELVEKCQQLEAELAVLLEKNANLRVTNTRLVEALNSKNVL
jgi:ribosomal protein L29